MRPPVVFVTGSSRLAAKPTHHGSADEGGEGRNRGASGGLDHLTEGDANGNPQRPGMRDGSGHGEVLVRDGSRLRPG